MIYAETIMTAATFSSAETCFRDMNLNAYFNSAAPSTVRRPELVTMTVEIRQSKRSWEVWKSAFQPRKWGRP